MVLPLALIIMVGVLYFPSHNISFLGLAITPYHIIAELKKLAWVKLEASLILTPIFFAMASWQLPLILHWDHRYYKIRLKMIMHASYMQNWTCFTDFAKGKCSCMPLICKIVVFLPALRTVPFGQTFWLTSKCHPNSFQHLCIIKNFPLLTIWYSELEAVKIVTLPPYFS